MQSTNESDYYYVCYNDEHGNEQTSRFPFVSIDSSNSSTTRILDIRINRNVSEESYSTDESFDETYHDSSDMSEVYDDEESNESDDSENTINDELDSEDIIEEDSEDIEEGSEDIIEEDSEDIIEEDSEDIIEEDSEDTIEEDSEDIDEEEDSQDTIDDEEDSQDAIDDEEDSDYQGLSEIDINKFPTKIYRTSFSVESGEQSNKRVKLTKECKICLEEFENNEVLLVLPCFHDFHENCIRPWLFRNNSCPECRYKIRV